MKKILGIVVLGLLLSGNAYAQNFKFNEVYMCGPKKIPYSEQYNDRGWYYVIHLDKDERFIIRNNEYNYSSFENTIYPHLWVQNGKITNGSLSKDGSIYNFELTSIYSPGSSTSYKQIKFLNVNFDSLTYVSRAKNFFADGSTKMYDPTIGVCWKEWEKKF
tara:strand:+ start:401 stop:883 length:483 start_codon:yes stop_codon:yes gene_type:complete